MTGCKGEQPMHNNDMPAAAGRHRVRFRPITFATIDPNHLLWRGFHNGLHTFANLDEIHRRVLKKCGLSME